MLIKVIKNKMRGFTLLEVLLSTTLFCLVAMGAAYPIAAMKGGSVASEEKMIATLLVENQMAEIRRKYWLTGDIVGANEISEAFNIIQLEMPSVTQLQVNCFEAASNSTCDPETTQGLRKMVVSLSWLGRAGHSKQISMTTYVYR